MSVEQALYRLRLINGSNARILKIGFSDNRPFHLIANDAGLLAAPVAVTSFFLPPGSRGEILGNFSGDAIGAQIILRTLTFSGGGMGPPGSPRQGTPMDILRFTVDRAGPGGTVPASLVPFTPWNPAAAVRTRRFTLSSVMGGGHFINDQRYAIGRTDFTVPRGELEIWDYFNSTADPHPVHLHGAHFQVLSRSSIAALSPEDTGWKDTVLVNAGETARVLVKFEAYGGVFVHHCHNLEHEDDGMMQNFQVLSAPAETLADAALQCGRAGELTELSWLPVWPDLTLESATGLDVSAAWKPVPITPVLAAGRYRVSVVPALAREFFRLRHP
jgi:blue copper oxidase